MYHNKLWFIVEANGDGVGAQAAADDHPFSILLKLPSAAGQKELILGRHHSPEKGQSDGSPVEMAGEHKICPPAPVCVKKQGRMGKKDLKPLPVRRPGQVLHIPDRHPGRAEFLIIFFRQIDPGYGQIPVHRL